MKTREHLAAIGQYLLNRLHEPSTYRGLIILFSAGGWAALDGSSKGELIAQVGMMLAGLIQAAVPQAALYKR